MSHRKSSSAVTEACNLRRCRFSFNRLMRLGSEITQSPPVNLSKSIQTLIQGAQQE